MNTSKKEKLFLELLENHKARIYRICWGFSNRSQEVEDLFQEVILRLWTGIEGFEGNAALSTWIYRITVNTCLYWKEKHKRKTILSIDNRPEMATADNAENALIQNERAAQLRAAIQELSKPDRTIALLLLEELSYKEIAEVTGLKINNVGVKITRIKARIKKIMLKSAHSRE